MRETLALNGLTKSLICTYGHLTFVKVQQEGYRKVFKERERVILNKFLVVSIEVVPVFFIFHFEHADNFKHVFTCWEPGLYPLSHLTT